MRLLRPASVLAALWLTACGAANFDRPGAGGDEASYAGLHPYYAEYCALSEIRKKPGYGADIRGGVGGHAVFFLQGACQDPATRYPLLRVCDAGAGPRNGVGLSMNAHFSNAKWVATPGRALFFDGGLPPGAPLTRDAYDRAKAEARRVGLYDAVTFHPEVFADMPADTTAEAYKYEVSIATDYAIDFGRGRFCARVPVTRAEMGRMVAFLNAENAPYRDGQKAFRWSVFQDNCIHLAHNALAAAGLWDARPTNRFLPLAMLDFPVPRNEFVNLARRTNDLGLDDLAALFRDGAVRRSVLGSGELPTRPGALVDSVPPRHNNDVYDTDLALIFYDDPLFGPYQGWSDAIFAEPRYFDARRNLAHFADLYRRLRAGRRPLDWWLARGGLGPARREFPAFYDRFYRILDRDGAAVEAEAARLREGPGDRALLAWSPAR